MTGPFELGVLIVDLALSGLAAFVAIMVWSLTREPARMLLVVGVILRFGDVLFQTLDRFGILTIADIRVLDLPLFWVLLRAVPLIFIILGLAVMVRDLRL